MSKHAASCGAGSTQICAHVRATHADSPEPPQSKHAANLRRPRGRHAREPHARISVTCASEVCAFVHGAPRSKALLLRGHGHRRRLAGGQSGRPAEELGCRMCAQWNGATQTDAGTLATRAMAKSTSTPAGARNSWRRDLFEVIASQPQSCPPMMPSSARAPAHEKQRTARLGARMMHKNCGPRGSHNTPINAAALRMSSTRLTRQDEVGSET